MYFPGMNLKYVLRKIKLKNLLKLFSKYIYVGITLFLLLNLY
jgi:hypothetical protein